MSLIVLWVCYCRRCNFNQFLFVSGFVFFDIANKHISSGFIRLIYNSMIIEEIINLKVFQNKVLLTFQIINNWDKNTCKNMQNSIGNQYLLHSKIIKFEYSQTRIKKEKDSIIAYCVNVISVTFGLKSWKSQKNILIFGYIFEIISYSFHETSLYE